MIELRDITVTREKKTLLCELSYELEKGGVHGVLGASRESVSALLDIICGAAAIEDGYAFVCGYNMSTERKNAKRKIGYMPYPLCFYEDMTVYEHLLFVGEAKSVAYDKLYKNIKSALELTELEPIAERLIKKLTATERKRLGIASAMLGNPDLIVLNEPQCDSIELTELLKKLGKIKTVVVASSDAALLESTCDDLLILSCGKELIFGTLSEISQRLAKNKSLTLTVKGNEAMIVSKLREIGRITDCTVTTRDSGRITLKIEYPTQEDIREEIFSLFAASGMPILSMEETLVGLCDIYSKLCDIENEKGGEGK